MARTYTKKDLLEELETTTYQIDVLKRTFEKQRENYDEVLTSASYLHAGHLLSQDK